MRAKRSIYKDTSAKIAGADTGRNAALRVHQPAPSTDMRVFPQSNEFAATNFPTSRIKYRFPLLRGRTFHAFQPSNKRITYELGKRGMDMMLSSTLMLLTLPVFACVAILIKATSPGPVFFRHKRLGRNGKEFWCVKFRTMESNAEERLKKEQHLRELFENNYKLKNDPRITPLGVLLRKTSIDELPQLWQVFKGEMSLIGPRPIVHDELSKYSIYADKFLSVKPGLSGLWQACGRSDTTYAERVLMDMEYINRRCLTLDLRLLLLTVKAVCKKTGAC